MSEAVKRRVLVLDDDRDFCDLLQLLFESRAGVQCLALRKVSELIARCFEAMACELAILDVNLGAGEPSGIDALAWLRANRFGGAIVFLTGHAGSHPLLAQASESARVRVLEKPVETRTLLALLDGAQASRSNPVVSG